MRSLVLGVVAVLLLFVVDKLRMDRVTVHYDTKCRLAEIKMKHKMQGLGNTAAEKARAIEQRKAAAEGSVLQAEVHNLRAQVKQLKLQLDGTKNMLQQAPGGSTLASKQQLPGRGKPTPISPTAKPVRVAHCISGMARGFPLAKVHTSIRR